MATNIKITALSDITSANMTYNDLVAVVDMNGTPETKKSTVQLVGNLILAGAGGSNFVPAAVATLAGDVTNAAQPNITSVGNLTSANVTGNLDAGNINATTAVTAAYFSGDGANLTNVPAGAATSITDGTSNVDIPTTDGNVVVGVGGTPDVLIATSTGVNVTGTFNATGVITGDAGGISNVVYANVTGTPTLGNISPLNLDGNVSNVLRGDGTFAADSESTYGDSNVVTLLNAFGSNTITTTGLVTADGGGISNVPYANVTGTPTLGNISTINIDGNSANYLDGTGAWGPVVASTAATVTDPAQPIITSVGTLTSLTVSGNVDAGNINATGGNFTYVTGDGANLTAIAGANVTGEVPFAAVANSVAGANVSGEVGFAATANAVAYANVSGTPTLGNIASIDIDGSASNVLYGNGVFAPASAPALTGDGYQLSNLTGANVSGTVSFADTANNVALANVLGAGNIASIDIDGAAGNVLYGNGVFAAAPGGGSYGDSNVVTLLNAFGSNTITTSGDITTTGFFEGDLNGAVTVDVYNATGVQLNKGDAVYLTGVNTGDTPQVALADSDDPTKMPAIGVIRENIADASTGQVVTSGIMNDSAHGYTLGADLYIGSAPGTLTTTVPTGQSNGIQKIGKVISANHIIVQGAFRTNATPNLDEGNIFIGNATNQTTTANLQGEINTHLAAFGSNTITTTGLITGDGGGLSNIAGANVTGTINTAVLAQEVINSAQPNIGSVGTLSELLVSNTIVSVGLTANTGDITVTAGVFAGDGGSISNVVGANVSGEVGFAAVANSVAIANVSGAGNIATVNLDGNTANYLDGTGSWGPVTATTATTAGTVTTAAQPNITSLGTLVDLTVTGNIAGGNINANTNGFAIGYKEIPPVVLSADDTIALEDSGKHFRSTTAGNITLSIPTNATVAFPTGTAISIVEQAAGNILVNAISGVTLYQAGNSTAGNRVISTYGVATLMKVDTDTWFISGTGVS